MLTQTLADSLSSLPWLWIGARTTGVISWLAATTAVVFGLSFRTRIFAGRLSPRTTTTIHRTATLVTLLFAVSHVTFLLFDKYAQIRLIDVFVPWISQDRTLGDGLGTVAFDLLLLVSLASFARRRMSARTWSVLHVGAYAVWPAATYHYLIVGSDVVAIASILVIGAALAAVNWLVIRRGFREPTPRRRSKPAAPKPSNTVGAAQQMQGSSQR